MPAKFLSKLELVFREPFFVMQGPNEKPGKLSIYCVSEFSVCTLNKFFR